MPKDPFRFYSNKTKLRNSVNRFACASSSTHIEDNDSTESLYRHLIEEIIEYYKKFCIIINKMNKIKSDYQNKKIPDNVKEEFIDLDNEKNNYKKLINDSMLTIEKYVKILEETNSVEYNEFYLKAVYENSTHMWKFIKN